MTRLWNYNYATKANCSSLREPCHILQFLRTEKREIVTNTPEKDGGIEAVKKNAVDGTVVDRGRVIDPDLENVERGESDRETGSVEIVMKEIAGIANATEKKDMNESEGGIEMERGIKVRGKIPVKRALPLRTPKLPKQTPCEPN